MLAPGGNNHRAFFVVGVGEWEGVIAPLTNEEAGGGVAGHPDQCPLAKVCHGEALPWPSLQDYWDWGAARVHLGGEEGIVWRSGEGGP